MKWILILLLPLLLLTKWGWRKWRRERIEPDLVDRLQAIGWPVKRSERGVDGKE